MAMDFNAAFPRQTLLSKQKGKKWREECVECPQQYIVYKHINNSNGHVYVGITKFVNNPNKRWRSGLAYKRHTWRFWNAINKYGWENFAHECEIVDSKDAACKREQELVSLYKSLGISYNITNGGEGSSAMTDEIREKLSQYTPWIKGKHHTDESRKKISEAGRGRKMNPELNARLKEINHLRPHIVSEETKMKESIANGHPVLQIDKKTGEVVAEFHSAGYAELVMSGRKSGHVSEVCLGRPKRRTAYGYKWRYKE